MIVEQKISQEKARTIIFDFIEFFKNNIKTYEFIDVDSKIECKVCFSFANIHDKIETNFLYLSNANQLKMYIDSRINKSSTASLILDIIEKFYSYFEKEPSSQTIQKEEKEFDSEYFVPTVQDSVEHTISDWNIKDCISFEGC